MITNLLNSKRVKRDKDKNDLFDLLCKNKNQSVFTKYTDLMVFAASLGHKKNISRPIKVQGESVQIQNFDDGGIILIDLLALNEYEEDDILNNSNEDSINKKIKLFEEYCNGGLEYISNKILDKEYEAFEIIKEIVIDETTNKEEKDETTNKSLADILEL